MFAFAVSPTEFLNQTIHFFTSFVGTCKKNETTYFLTYN